MVIAEPEKHHVNAFNSQCNSLENICDSPQDRNRGWEVGRVDVPNTWLLHPKNMNVHCPHYVGSAFGLSSVLPRRFQGRQLVVSPTLSAGSTTMRTRCCDRCAGRGGRTQLWVGAGLGVSVSTQQAQEAMPPMPKVRVRVWSPESGSGSRHECGDVAV